MNWAINQLVKLLERISDILVGDDGLTGYERREMAKKWWKEQDEIY